VAERLARVHPTLRARIVLWYALILALTIATIGSLLYVQTRLSLYEGVDRSLQAAIAEAAANIETDNSRLAFRSRDDVDVVVREAGAPFAVRILASDGRLADGGGDFKRGPLWPRPSAGFENTTGRDGRWRVLTSPLMSKGGSVVGWLQVAEPTQYISDALRGFRAQLLLMVPLLLVFGGAGGILLVRQALKPIASVIETADSISSSDLSRRIAYAGPADELSRLASTFDRMLDRLQEGFDAERRLTADVSHELRTPLAAIKGQIDVALGRPRSADEYRAVLASLAAQTDRIVRLTNDLLLLSKLERARAQSMDEVNLSDLIDATVDHLRPLAAQRSIVIDSSDLAEDLHVLGDFDQLMRLAYNLLDNAVKYTPRGGDIAVAAACPAGEEARLTISNSGPGIAAEHLDRIFDPFYRVSSDRNRTSGGAGLGLAIAREIVRAHGGSLQAASGDGRTSFTVILPRTRRHGSGNYTAPTEVK
jgi:heavy metal sensor kinase